MGGKRSTGHDEHEPTTREKEALVIRLRKAGATYEQIAAEVGYGSAASAYKAFKRAMDRTIREPADEYRNLHRDRLEELYRLNIDTILNGGGNPRDKAYLFESSAKILAALAKLDGLDAPKKVHDVTPLFEEIRQRAIDKGLTPDEAERVARDAIQHVATAR